MLSSSDNLDRLNQNGTKTVKANEVILSGEIMFCVFITVS